MMTRFTDAAGVPREDAYYCINPTVTFQHELHRNEIWVVGLDPITQHPIIDLWLDARSQTDEDWPYYVGERRVMVALTRLPTAQHVERYLDNLRRIFGCVRRKISFTSKLDPYLTPKYFINFYGLGFVFQVMSTGVEITSEMTSQSYDDTVHGCRIEAIEWPLDWAG